MIKRSALKKVFGFYTEYAAFFDRELSLAMNICEVQKMKKVKNVLEFYVEFKLYGKKTKRRKRMGPNDATLTTGISRLLATVQASANSVGMLPDTTGRGGGGSGKGGKKGSRGKANSISDSLGSVMKTAIIPTDSGRQSVCSDDQSTSED